MVAKKKNVMQAILPKEWESFSWVLVFAIVVLLVGLFWFLNRPFSYELSEKSVYFFSNDFPIETGLQELSSQTDFVVVVPFSEQNPLNQQMANAQNLFSVVLIANHKKSVNVFRVFSPENELLSCRSNDGNALVDREWTPAECNAFLDSFEGVSVDIAWPDSTKLKAEVVLKPNRIEVHSSNSDDLKVATYSTLKKMFSNTDEVLALVNQIAGGVR